MASKFVFRSPSDREYLALPRDIRLSVEEVLPDLLRHPFRSGPGFRVAEVRGYPGLWKLRLTDFPPGCVSGGL